MYFPKFGPFYDQTQWQASLTYKEWLTDYWAIIRSVWTEEIFKAKTLNNRRCFVDGDYLSTYTEFEDQNVDNCNRADYDEKPRTLI